MAGKFRAAAGKVAIWTGGTDLAPFNNPLANMGRVKFHSDLNYIRVVQTLDRVVVLPAIPSTGSGGSDAGARVATYNLGPHGQGRTPFIVGVLTVGGVPMAFTGSVLVHSTDGDAFGRFIALGADSTSIYVHEYSVQSGLAQSGSWAARPQQTFALRLHITDVSL